MTTIQFLRPEVLWVLAAVVVAAGLWRVGRQRRRFAAGTTFRLLAPRVYHASPLRRLPVWCIGAAVVLLAFALTDPVLPSSATRIQSLGLDIVVVLDLSVSMQKEMDRERTRLAVTKSALRSFVADRAGDRLGLIVFSDNAYLVSPLTFDHEYLLQYIDMVDERMLMGEGNTAIGEGIGLANQLIARQSANREQHNRVTVVFTDGENNAGRDPIEAIEEADGANTRVHIVGVDLEEVTRNRPKVLQLIEVVRQYGGQYFDADTARALNDASREINALEKGYLSSVAFVRNVPVYQWFAVPALLCLGLAFAVGAVPYFVDLT